MNDEQVLVSLCDKILHEPMNGVVLLVVHKKTNIKLKHTYKYSSTLLCGTLDRISCLLGEKYGPFVVHISYLIKY